MSEQFFALAFSPDRVFCSRTSAPVHSFSLPMPVIAMTFLGLNGRVRPWLPLLVQNAQLWRMRRLREDGDLNHLPAASICEAPTGARKANLNGVPLLR